MADSQTPRRVLLKLSGEALMGDQDFGISESMMTSVIEALTSAVETGVELGVVVGGGNLFRGVQGTAERDEPHPRRQHGDDGDGDERARPHRRARASGQRRRAFCAIEMPRVMELFRRDAADQALKSGAICVFAGGTGNPFFTTDSAARLRAAELNADELVKGTQVDGVYEADPRVDPNARRYEQVSFATCLQRQLKVMDASAFAICRDEQINVRVFNMHRDGALARALIGDVPGTLVGVGLTDQYAEG